MCNRIRAKYLAQLLFPVDNLLHEKNAKLLTRILCSMLCYVGNYFGHICVDTCSGVKVRDEKNVKNLLEHLLLPTLIIIVVIL